MCRRDLLPPSESFESNRLITTQTKVIMLIVSVLFYGEMNFKFFISDVDKFKKDIEIDYKKFNNTKFNIIKQLNN